LTLLITGSSGHLGQAIVTLLRRAGRDAIGLDMRPAETTDIVGSITDAKTVAKAMQGVTGVIHTATLHKPHVATHSRQDFVDTNVTGTLSLLDSARDAGASAFVFTSTTSAFGRALTPGPEDPAAWITEDVRDRPKNIYGATKTGAEALCDLAAHRDRLPVVILRCARFFPEPDDSADARASFSDANLKANEFLHRWRWGCWAGVMTRRRSLQNPKCAGLMMAGRLISRTERSRRTTCANWTPCATS